MYIFYFSFFYIFASISKNLQFFYSDGVIIQLYLCKIVLLIFFINTKTKGFFMNTIKIALITLALMTTSALADFTVKDLFVSGGTQGEERSKDKRKNT